MENNRGKGQSNGGKSQSYGTRANKTNKRTYQVKEEVKPPKKQRRN